MRYVVLATDYDGTLAHDALVPDGALESLKRVRQSGRKLILVTGRELPHLESVFPHLGLFDRVGAENGALLHNPATKETRLLAPSPSPTLMDRLRVANLPGLSVGQVTIALWRPPGDGRPRSDSRSRTRNPDHLQQRGCHAVSRPASNRRRADRWSPSSSFASPATTSSLWVTPKTIMPFLRCSECAVAVANAIPSLKRKADLVTQAARGDGVTELVEHLIRTDLNDVARKGRRSNARGQRGRIPSAQSP